jgi:ribonuclease I
LERKQKAYFEAWDRELAAINDEEIRKTSEARKAEVSKQFEATNRKQQEAQDALVPLVGYLDDIRRGFTADLTTAGLQAAKPATAEANNKKAIVQANLAQAASDLEALGGRMSSYLVTEGDKHTH